MTSLPHRPRAFLGLLLFLATLLPLRLMRASAEQSLWIDETASLMLASHPVSVILDQCAVDTNPPGYFLALKAWLKLGKVVSSAPGILWARSLGTLAWLLSAVAIWWLGRSLAPRGQNLFLATVAGSAFAAVSAQDARGYSLAVPALAVAFLLIMDLYAHPERPRRNQMVRWLLVGLALAFALWSHVLSALVFGLLVLIFVALACRRRTLEFALGGAVSLALAALSFLPWSIKVLTGIGALRASNVSWMTPATVPNLLAVFYYWFPYGRIGGPGRHLLDLLGLASVLLPLAAAFLRGRRRRRQANPVLLGTAALGLLGAVAFVALLWLLQRSNLMTVFYAPRYPALAAGLWASGLAALAVGAAEGAAHPRCLAWLLLAPWLLASLAGQVWAMLAERQGGLQEMRAHFAPYLPPRGASLYVMPSELIPFFRQTFAEFRAQPLEALPCDLAAHPGAATTVLDLNFWHSLDRPRDLIAREIIASGTLARRVDEAAFPDWRRDYALYRLAVIDSEAAAELCRRGFAPTPRPVPALAVAVALPEQQRYEEGWSYPEVAPDLTIRRWAGRAATEILFDRALGPGTYLLHLRGYNPEYPATPSPIAVESPGQSPAQSRSFAAGEFVFDLPLDFAARHDPLRLRVTRATWSPKTATGAGDARVLSFLFEYAWVEAAPPATARSSQ